MKKAFWVESVSYFQLPVAAKLQC